MPAYEFLYQEDLYRVNDSVLIVIDKSWIDCSDEEKLLLSKILSSVKLSLDKVQVVNSPKDALPSLLAYQPSKIISFGVALSDVFEPYKYHALENTSLIQCDSLSQLDDQKKKSLWGALKQAFTI